MPFTQNGRPLLAGLPGPVLLCLIGQIDGFGYLCHGAVGDLGNHLAGGGVDDIKGLVKVSPLTTDEGAGF